MLARLDNYLCLLSLVLLPPLIRLSYKLDELVVFPNIYLVIVVAIVLLDPNIIGSLTR